MMRALETAALMMACALGLYSIWNDLRRLPWPAFGRGLVASASKGDRPFFLMVAAVAAFEYATGIIGR